MLLALAVTPSCTDDKGNYDYEPKAEVTIKLPESITVLANAEYIDLKPEIVDPDDIETLSDTLVAAVNQAIKKVEETNAAEMQKITGDINVPGLV